MGNNLVKDVSALVGNSQLPALRSFYLYGNPLTEATLAAHIPRLREAGVSVYRAVALALDASAREGDDHGGGGAPDRSRYARSPPDMGSGWRQGEADSIRD